jgi:hypothetical protein
MLADFYGEDNGEPMMHSTVDDVVQDVMDNADGNEPIKALTVLCGMSLPNLTIDITTKPETEIEDEETERSFSPAKDAA